MSSRRVYLAKSGSRSQRTHFGIFIPNAEYDRPTTPEDFQTVPCIGTIIHVIGEPVMAGYAHEVKRNFDCTTDVQLKKLVYLGHIPESCIFEPSSTTAIQESHPRSRLEIIATNVRPPPRGQDVRAPIDGETTKRCQEWTMEYLTALVQHKLIDETAIQIAQAERDPPRFGVFGQPRV